MKEKHISNITQEYKKIQKKLDEKLKDSKKFKQTQQEITKKIKEESTNNK